MLGGRNAAQAKPVNEPGTYCYESLCCVVLRAVSVCDTLVFQIGWNLNCDKTVLVLVDTASFFFLLLLFFCVCF